ncbi:hypothetical protein L6452_41929 [Arctium lappa]|uniref:Uncharacterized protein n=1 Tax=Arctium lappa TaxID=4217 RepID=A0ACB8XGV4_ARCLA|nr:hypothetical protein L6452_41929 [Arctium lappa]
MWTMIARGLYAPVHQHFFVACMDMSVDCKHGESHNQVVELNVKVEELVDGNNNHEDKHEDFDLGYAELHKRLSRNQSKTAEDVVYTETAVHLK